MEKRRYAEADCRKSAFFWGENPPKSFPFRGRQDREYVEAGVSGDVYSEVSVGKADLKPHACPIECWLVKVGGEGAVSFV